MLQGHEPSHTLGRRFGPVHLNELLRPKASGPRTWRVRVASALTALDAPGGGEVQWRELLPALCHLGINAQGWQPWTEGFQDFDCLHLFGSHPEHVPLIEAARRHRLKVALSPVAWFDLASRWHGSRTLRGRLSGCAGHVLRRGFPRWPHWRRRLYDMVDLLLPNSQAEARQLVQQFGVDPGRMRVIPNAASPRFIEADPRPFARQVGGRGYILYAGRVEPRKNQLGFLRAMRGCDHRIVILGDAVPGHESYLQACRNVAGKNVTFVGALAHADPMLTSAYAACGCLALTSWFETPGLVALEAAMSGTPLVLTDRGCTREYFGSLASYASPNRPASIRAAVQRALEQPRRSELAELVQQRYTWQQAALATSEAYEQLQP
jgi:glycosyltransferase involved in cell wall biosynthesis